MRITQIVGVVLIASGLFLIMKPPSYTSEESVLKVGDIEAKMQREHQVPGWVGGVAAGAGLVLVVVGLRNRS